MLVCVMSPERFNEALSRSGFNKYRLAKATGLSTSIMDKWARGDVKDPYYSTVILIARELNVSPDWLMGGDDNMVSEPAALYTVTNSQLAPDAALLMRLARQLSPSSLSLLGELSLLLLVRERGDIGAYQELRNRLSDATELREEK